MTEYHVEDVHAYSAGKLDSLIVVIPKTVQRMLNIKRGAKFHVKVDAKGRLIYEPAQEAEP